MKILLIHNYYQERGGEDTVFEAEIDLLRQNNQLVESLYSENTTISTQWDKLRTGIFSIYNPFSALEVSKKITEFQPDIIHVHNFFPMISPAIFSVAKHHRIPVVMTLHNFRLICPNALLYRDGQVCESCIDKVIPWEGIRHACYRNSALQTASLGIMTAFHKLAGTWQNDVDCYITLNSFARGRILNSSLKLKPQQVVVKPNFVFEPESPYDDAVEKEDFFLFVGRLSQEKGVQVMLDSFIQNGKPLKIIGKGPLQTIVEESVSNYANVNYLGFLGRDDILKYLVKARALVLPSTCYENFPMTILEAFSAGTPVITSRNGGLPDIVTEDFNGLLATPGCADSLSGQVEKMASTTDYMQFCRNARDTYLEKYTPQKNYEMLMTIYSNVLSGYHAGKT
jgi:glycosyltransferase involved in cell wall biosynthesis